MASRGAAVEHSKGERLGDMAGEDGVDAIEIGKRSPDAEDLSKGACGEAEPLSGPRKQRGARFVEGGKPLKISPLQARVARGVGSMAAPFCLRLAGGDRAGTDNLGGLAALPGVKCTDFDRWEHDVKIEAID
jgi:hypothetical protein